MNKKVVAMIAIKGAIARGGGKRSDLSYLPYARATWEWWCAERGIEFVVVEETEGTKRLPDAPPTMQRWFVPAEIIRARGPETRVALVDADTMIRWDAPDFLAFSPDNLVAVTGRNYQWIQRSIFAFQQMFPTVALRPEEYFNAGLVVVGPKQLDTLAKFCEFCGKHLPELQDISRSAEVGTDQTPLNFVVRQESAAVSFLDRRFNFLNCFGYENETRRYFEFSPAPDWSAFSERAFSAPQAFDFIETGFIWHFTNVVAARTPVMAETWRRVKDRYPPTVVNSPS